MQNKRPPDDSKVQSPPIANADEGNQSLTENCVAALAGNPTVVILNNARLPLCNLQTEGNENFFHLIAMTVSLSLKLFGFYSEILKIDDSAMNEKSQECVWYDKQLVQTDWLFKPVLDDDVVDGKLSELVNDDGQNVYDDGQNVKNEKIVEMVVAEKEKALSWKDLLIGQLLLITKYSRENLLGLGVGIPTSNVRKMSDDKSNM